ncbi:MAG: hypothetical protein HY756_05810 [Nitrospirae bacterium]|nr:hypothetical protein [Nitrospirota bacterium]
MEIDVKIGKESIAFNIDNPFMFDEAGMLRDIVGFGTKHGVNLSGFSIDRLIKRMIKGVAGCEDGCPADAKAIVRAGFGSFSLSYIEGGILSAKADLGNGTPLEVKVFPEF